MDTIMNNFEKTKSHARHGIRKRLFIGFSSIILLMIIAISIVLYKITSIESFSSSVFNNELRIHEHTFDLDIKINQTQNIVMKWMITKDPQYKTLFNANWNLISDIEKNIDDSQKWNNIQFKNWQDIKALLLQLKSSQEQIFINTDAQNTTFFINTVIPNMNKLLDILDGPITNRGDRSGGLFDIQSKNLEENSQSILSDLHFIRVIEYIFLALLLVISTVIALYTSKGISYITNQITDSCQNMITSITEVKHVVDVQSSGASEQASSINEITASLEEIEKSSTQTIEKAKALGIAAERTRKKGQMGLDAVEQSISGMKSVRDKVEAIAQTIVELSNQTQQVGEITAVVNTLSQQSKMLALNASIEAAKAGDAGKGFAVVASEVKNLAEQSEQSTTQVQKILEDIRRATEKAVMATEEGTKGVDLGTKLVEQTGDVVRSLSDVIHETSIASQQIEAAIRQEGIGIEQITAGMNEINQVTSSFVDSVKQTTEAVDNLASTLQNLKQYTELYQ